jgi:hypothetical protein
MPSFGQQGALYNELLDHVVDDTEGEPVYPRAFTNAPSPTFYYPSSSSSPSSDNNIDDDDGSSHSLTPTPSFIMAIPEHRPRSSPRDSQSPSLSPAPSSSSSSSSSSFYFDLDPKEQARRHHISLLSSRSETLEILNPWKRHTNTLLEVRLNRDCVWRRADSEAKSSVKTTMKTKEKEKMKGKTKEMEKEKKMKGAGAWDASAWELRRLSESAAFRDYYAWDGDAYGNTYGEEDEQREWAYII